MITAAHCPDLLRYENFEDPTGDKFISLTLEVGAGKSIWDGSHDVQWHPVPSPYVADFSVFAGSTTEYGARALTGSVQSPTEASVGTAVCHRGTRTGYSCGYIDMVDYAPGTSACNYRVCESTWMMVSGPNMLCDEGDSGGPVFSGARAYGIATSASTEGPSLGQCEYLVAMPLSKTKDIGVIVR